MKITNDQLKGWGVCGDHYDWFLRRFPDGKPEYQDVLNALAKDDLPTGAAWLMSHAGPDEQSVIKVESIADCQHFFAAGSLVIKTSATVSGRLRAGMSIIAGQTIEAGQNIEAGRDIDAGMRIQAGWEITSGMGIDAVAYIKAGLGIQARTGIEAGWDIQSGADIRAGWFIRAGMDIQSSMNIRSGMDIQAGGNIQARMDIESGDGYGIFAGMQDRKSVV